MLQVLSQLLRKAKQKNLVIPNVKQAGSEQGTYEGATVSLAFRKSSFSKRCKYMLKRCTYSDDISVNNMNFFLYKNMYTL